MWSPLCKLSIHFNTDRDSPLPPEEVHYLLPTLYQGSANLFNCPQRTNAIADAWFFHVNGRFDCDHTELRDDCVSLGSSQASNTWRHLLRRFWAFQIRDFPVPQVSPTPEGERACCCQYRMATLASTGGGYTV